MDKHKLRIEIFNSTLVLLQQGWYLSGHGNKVELPGVCEVMGAAKMYNAPFAVNKPEAAYNTEVVVENKDCVVSAMEIIDMGYPYLFEVRVARLCEDAHPEKQVFVNIYIKRRDK